MKPPRHFGIGDNHRRAIGGTLRALDELLSQFERAMRDPPADGPMHRESDTLTERQKRAIRAETAALRALIEEARDRLGLEARTQDLAASVWSRSAAFWEALVELESRRLRGYGDISADFAACWDPLVRQLVEHLRNITEASSPRRRAPDSVAP